MSFLLKIKQLREIKNYIETSALIAALTATFSKTYLNLAGQTVSISAHKISTINYHVKNYHKNLQLK